jgi:hypothetical protein
MSRMITSFIIPYLDWQARNRLWGHLSETLVYRASEATTIRKHLPTSRYLSSEPCLRKGGPVPGWRPSNANSTPAL